MTWKFKPADDDSMDSEYVLVGTPFAVQDCRSYGGGHAVNEYHYSGGSLTGVTFHKAFNSLRAAKAYAEKAAR